jgi:excisionase family DNA binding protein
MAASNDPIQKLDADSVLTSHQVGALLQVNPSSINNWIREGRLPAFRTPGGHRRIRASDLVSFLREHQMPVPAALSPGRSARILWVDDDAVLLRGLKRAFRAFPEVEARFVDNGVEALVTVGAFRPTAVVLDMQMPGMDGLEVLRRLKSGEATRDMDIVIVSGCADPHVVAAAEKAGALAYLFKPVRVTSVLEVLGVTPATPRGAATGQE